MSGERQQRRQRRRHLLQEAEAAVKRGLPQVPRKESLVGLTLLLKDTLGDAKRPDRASAAGRTMLDVLQASVRAAPGALKLACSKGCNFCCHGWVSATAPELFLIARTVAGARAGNAQLSPSAVLARAAVSAGLSIADRAGRKLPCPLLVEGTCSVYAARPAVCHQTTAIDVAGCIEEYEGRGVGGDIAVSRVYLDHARNARMPLQAALAACGLSRRSYELSAGLIAALAPGAEAAWLAGQDPFENVATAPSDPDQLARAIDVLAAEAAAA